MLSSRSKAGWSRGVVSGSSIIGLSYTGSVCVLSPWVLGCILVPLPPASSIPLRLIIPLPLLAAYSTAQDAEGHRYSRG